ncbi:MAG: OmpA family protein [Phycisphaerales bacterium]
MKITHRIARGRTIALTTLLVAVAGLGTGCVSQQEYDRLYETNQSLRSQNADLQNRLGTLESNNSQLQGSAGDAQGVIGRLRSENTTLRDQLAASQNAFASLEDRMNSMSIVQLDPATDRALSDLASQYPDMIVYDGESGMLRFVSDLTFASGSDQVQPSAMDSLKTLASVLSSNTASKYDLRIVGHTDDEKPGANTRRNHPTNVHLSAHRAISVRKALGDAGLDWSRMSVTGWGEYRPIVANNPGKGTAANRRVEIYLVPSTRSNLSVSPSLENATSNTPSTPVDTRPKIDPTK